jgi:DNA-binding CsgD family transcriptional regulator
MIITPEPTAARLKDMLDAAGQVPVRITLSGARGSGRTHLLNELKRLLRADGAQVLTARHEPVPHPNLSVFHQLFSPVSRYIAKLSRPDRAALEQAFGLVEEAAGGQDGAGLADLAEAAAALLELLSVDGSVVLLIDDWERLDEQSGTVLDRLLITLPDQVRLVRTATVDPRAGPPGLTSGPETLVYLTPWDLTRSERFLDGQPDRPRGQLRHQILVQARGNPLALAELARYLARRPELQTPPGIPLPLTIHLTSVFAPGIGRLAPTTRQLLAIAAASRGDVADLIGASSLPARTVHGQVAAAEAPGLAVIRGGRLHFAHEMTRAAAYHSVSAAAIRRIHSMLGSCTRSAAWRAWHETVAAKGPDEAAASDLERAAVRLSAAGAPVAASYALLAAASSSADDVQHVRRTLLAATTARAAREIEWADELDAATPPGLPEGERPTDAVDLPDALQALARAAYAVYLAGRPDERDNLRSLLARRPAGRAAGIEKILRVWAGALLDPARHRDDALELIHQANPVVNTDMSGTQGSLPVPGFWVRRVAGLTALAMDETAEAIRHLTIAAESAAPRAPDPAALEALAWALVDAGRLREAAERASQLLALQPGLVPQPLRAGAATVRAIVGTWTAAPSHEEAMRAVVTGLDPHDLARLAVRVGRARGLAAASTGDYEGAWRHLRKSWDVDGTPAHEPLSDLAVGDLAMVAVRTHRQQEAASLLAGATGRARPGYPARRWLILHRARALLGDGQQAERSFRLALADVNGEQWPIERALTRLDYAEWLRRQQRPSDARPQLTAARDAFAAAALSLWSARAETELAASAPRPADHATSLVRLTPQQRAVAGLAAKGHSNQQIADQLFLSVRTVTTHLSRVFAQLGVTRRGQLAQALNELDRHNPPTAH